jgi:hypothetical protein
VTTLCPRIVAAMAAALLCAAAAPPGGGTISVELAGHADGPPVAPGVAERLRDALAERGFTILPGPGHSAYVAEVTLDRTAVGTGSARVSAGPAAVVPGLVGGAAGGGVTVPLSSGQARSVQLVRFELGLAIRERKSGAIVWRGAAVTVRAGDPSTRDAATVADLCSTVLRSYPHEAPGPVTIP